MLDPLTAFSLASGVVQLVDFSCKIISKGYEISRSKDGITDDIADIKTVTEHLGSVNDDLTRRLQQRKSSGSLDEDEKELVKICEECRLIGKDLLERLKTLEVKHGGHMKWKSLLKAFESMWKKGDLDAVAATLSKYQEQLNHRLLLSIWKRQDLYSLRYSARFDDLDRNDKRIFDLVARGQSVFEYHLEIQHDKLDKLIAGQDAILGCLRAPSPNPENPRNTELHDAVRSGDRAKLRDLIRAVGINVNPVNELGQSPLHLAAIHGHTDMVKQLCGCAARLDIEDNTGKTPLHWAALGRHEEIVRCLLTKGADKTMEDDTHHNALFYARKSSIVSWILMFGPELEARNPKSGNTALHQAAWMGDTEAARSLIRQWASINVKNNWNWTPLMHASKHCHVETLDLLLSKGAHYECRDEKGFTPLLIATHEDQAVGENSWNPISLKQREAVVRALLDKGANVHAALKTGETALASAMQKGRLEIIRLLIDKGADSKSFDKSKDSLLVGAAQRGDFSGVLWLIGRGANTEACGTNGWTALMEACHHGFDSIVKLLLERGAKPEARDNTNDTPLCRACRKGHLAIVCKLLERGARVNVQNHLGWTPLAHATAHSYREIVHLLLKFGANTEMSGEAFKTDGSGKEWTPLMRAARNGEEGIAADLLKSGARVDPKNSAGNTALMEACLRGHDAAARVLLKWRADVNAKTPKGNTSLMHAAGRGYDTTVALLLSLGADVEARTNSGRSALDMARHNSHEKAVSILLRAGARR